MEPDEERLRPPGVGREPVHGRVDVHLGGGLLGGGVDLGEPLAEPGIVIPQMAGGDQGQRVVAGRGELLGQRRMARRQRRLEIVDAVVLAVEAGHYRDEARIGDVEDRVGVGPDVALAGQAVEGRRGAGLPAPGAQGLGAQGVDADQQDVGPVSRAPLLRRGEVPAAVDRGAPPEHARHRLARSVRGRAVDLEEEVDLAAGPGGEIDFHRLGSERPGRLGVHLGELLDLIPLAEADAIEALLTTVGGAQRNEREIGALSGGDRPPHARAGPLLQGLHLSGGPLGEGGELLGRHQSHVPHLRGAEIGDLPERGVLPLGGRRFDRGIRGPEVEAVPGPRGFAWTAGGDQEGGQKEEGEGAAHGGGC